MSLEQAIEEIKKMFWGVLKGKFNPDEEEEVKVHLITNLATLTSYAKTYLPPEQQEEYETHFKKAKDALLKFDSAGPWFRELPEMIDTVYNIITHANMLQIEYRRYKGTETDSFEFLKMKIETLEMAIASMQEELKILKNVIRKGEIITLPKKVLEESESMEKPIEARSEEEAIAEKNIPSEQVADLIEEKQVEKEIVIKEVEKPEGLESTEKTEQIEETTLKTDSEKPEVELKKDKESESSEVKDLIEGIELASQYEFEHEPFVQNIDTEQESLKKLANLLSALDPGDDTVISPLTEKLLSLGDEEGTLADEGLPLLDQGLGTEELHEAKEFYDSVSRLSSVLSSSSKEDAAHFVSSIKKTIASVTQDKELEEGKKSKLTEIIEQETGEVEKPPVQVEDIENIIKHLEKRREKALERIQQLESALNSEKIDEKEWHELRIKAEQHMLRIEDTLDGYKRYLEKLQAKE
ncbi:MAG: hypothetical protein ACTSX6_02540 [Candidatus Heimdallarchaeaceae archaeon]